MTNTNLNNFILFEDAHLVILNKPAGLLSIEDGFDMNKENLRSILRKKYGSIWTVHRLDKNTSGVIIFAKNEHVHRKLNLDFSNQIIKKNYRGIINGIPINHSFNIDVPLRINGDRKHRTVFSEKEGKIASTFFNTIYIHGNFSYMDIFPKTGLTHQIRAHLASAGLPLFGDALYSRCCNFPKRTIIPQHKEESYYLHAFSISFSHPVIGTPIFIKAPLPKVFINMLIALKLSK